MIYFTSDLHLEHPNIIHYCGRPFRNVQQMNKVLIKNWNSVINEDDVVYMLGDLSIKPPAYKRGLWHFVDNMKGKKHLILGNHDYLEPFDYIDMGFISVHTMLWLEEFTLIHDPAQAYKINGPVLHGHVHQNWKKHKNAINVGVDVWDFKPVSIDDINIEIGRASCRERV